MTPQPFPLIAFARAWTPGTNGAITAEVVLATLDRDADFTTWDGKLRGKVVLRGDHHRGAALHGPRAAG